MTDTTLRPEVKISEFDLECSIDAVHDANERLDSAIYDLECALDGLNESDVPQELHALAASIKDDFAALRAEVYDAVSELLASCQKLELED
jgi:hypothetical protein